MNQSIRPFWHHIGAHDVLHELGTDATRGLDEAQAAQRLADEGANELVERGTRGVWHIVWEQFRSTMVVILIVAALISAFLGDAQDTIVILAIVALNAALGISQEYRAERAMAALKQLAVPMVRVRRAGHVRDISARDLVPGDLVLLEAGNRVPADGRVLQSASLRVQEAALTGESVPIDKIATPLPAPHLPLGDRHNMVYMGTVVTYGRGEFVVTATGMRTELGGIAALLQTLEPEPTPLQRRLDQLGRALAAAALAIVGVIFVLGLLRGENLRVLFLTALSMAVAAVPEGLPAVVTIALALGAQRMLARQALIRKLSAVETLGSVTVICADKTGTLTQNCMTVTVLDVAGQRLKLDAGAHSRTSLHGQPTVTLLLAGGALCNDALLEGDNGEMNALRIVGDPTEGALVTAAARLGQNKADLEASFPRLAELPFDSDRKLMTTIHAVPALPPSIPNPLAPLWDGLLGCAGASNIAFTKGAVDQLLAVSYAVWVEGKAEPLSADWRARIAAGNDHLAQEGMRVLGVAFRPLPALPSPEHLDGVEHDLIFVGMLGLLDPAREEAQAAVARCRTAGIRPLMITGDHPLTAQAIARDLGIAADGGILTGPDLDRLGADELERLVEEVAIYARVAPQHKLKIVQALQRRGQIVAMTGDGVNDAPALKQADIGVAMGVSGTDVAREAADMVLRDDNFATIVAAVAEGRVIYDNLRKFVKYLMTSNAGELWAMLLAPLAGMPLPLLPLQILWINLVTDGMPALALSVEPAERNLMQRPPRPPSEPIFAHGMGRHIMWVGLLMGLISLGVGYAYWSAESAAWQTMVFMTLTLAQMAHVLAIRSERDSLFRIGLRSNRLLLSAVLLTVLLQLAVVYMPPLQAIFSTVALSAVEVGICIALSSLIFWAVELEKWLGRRRAGRTDPAMEVSAGAASPRRRHREHEATHG